MVSLSISCPYLIEFHGFAYNIQDNGGWLSTKWGVQSGPTGHDFPDNFNIYFLIFTTKTEPCSKCENRSESQIGCQVRTWAILSFSENLQSGSHGYSHLHFSLTGSHWYQTENWGRFSVGGWEPLNTGKIPWSYYTL